MTIRRILLAVIVVLAVLLAVNTIVTDNETKSAKADIGRVVDLPGGDLQVREDGSPRKPPIVLLHGFASSVHWWTPVAERLKGAFHVVRIDLLGHGGSEKPDGGYTMENQAQLVAQALDKLGVRHAVIGGHSMGGAVATALAEQDPSRVDGLVLVCSPANKDAADLPFLARLGFVPVIGEAIRRVVPDGVVRDNLESAFAPGFDVPDQFVHDFNRMTYTSYDSSHEESDDYGNARDLADRVAALRKPLLAIQGAEDEIVDPDSARDYEKVPGAVVTSIANTGHSPMVEDPNRVTRLIRGFELRLRSRERRSARER